MPSSVLAAGIATGIGSLPHRDADAAAALVLRCLPDLPAAPQLPRRSPNEHMIAQSFAAVAGVHLDDAFALHVDASFDPQQRVAPELTSDAHAGLLAFVDAAAAAPRVPRRAKAQVTGPLTLGTALADAGVTPEVAFPFAARVARANARAVEELFSRRLPDTALVLFFDEPALVRWRGECTPYDRELATDVLSTALAAPGCIAGVHVCGAGDLRIALAAGPDVVHFDVDSFGFEDAISLCRFIDGGGWVAWGAIPTHGPTGEHPAPLWKALLDVWCELTRRGCDPIRLRSQALVAPACGLAGHGISQAQRAMLLAREIGNRVHDQARGDEARGGSLTVSPAE